jgi:hypothetical protein
MRQGLMIEIERGWDFSRSRLRLRACWSDEMRQRATGSRF